MVFYPIKHILHKKKKTLANELQLRFLKRLNRLLHNGYALIDALEIIAWDKQLIPTARQVRFDLQDGNTLDEALEHSGFSQAITTYLYVVRANGNLQKNILKSAEMYEQRLEYMKKIQRTVRYPLVLFIIFLLLLYFIKGSVLPSFTELFQGNSETSSVITFSGIIINGFTNGLIFLALLLGCSFFASKYIKRALPIQKQISIYNSIPVLRKYLRIQTSFLFATHVSSLLKTGMSMKEILEHIFKQKRLHILSYYASLMIDELSSGKPVAGLLTDLKLIDEQIPVIFEKNADVHALEKDLTTYSDLAAETLHRKITKVITLIQPIFFIILAGFIIFIYITLMWPMFQLLKTI